MNVETVSFFGVGDTLKYRFLLHDNKQHSIFCPSRLFTTDVTDVPRQPVGEERSTQGTRGDVC